MSHVRCFEFLGGVPEMVIPDNLKSGVNKACKYDPDLNSTYHQLSTHYNTAVIPARPYKPKDKSKAEVGVQIVERWIMARIRKETFFSLKQLNQRIYQHKNKLINGFSANYNLTKLVYFEIFDDMESAIIREKRLKEWQREWKERLIYSMNPKWVDLFSTII